MGVDSVGSGRQSGRSGDASRSQGMDQSIRDQSSRQRTEQVPDKSVKDTPASSRSPTTPRQEREELAIEARHAASANARPPAPPAAKTPSTSHPASTSAPRFNRAFADEIASDKANKAANAETARRNRWFEAYPELRQMDGKKGIDLTSLEGVEKNLTILLTASLPNLLTSWVPGNRVEDKFELRLGKILDPAFLVDYFCVSPDTFTGRDTFGLSAHGGKLDTRGNKQRNIEVSEMTDLIRSHKNFSPGKPIFVHGCKAGRERTYWQQIANATGSPVVVYTGSTDGNFIAGGQGVGSWEHGKYIPNLDGSHDEWRVIFPKGDQPPALATATYKGERVEIVSRGQTEQVEHIRVPAATIRHADGSVEKIMVFPDTLQNMQEAGEVTEER